MLFLPCSTGELYKSKQHNTRKNDVRFEGRFSKWAGSVV